MNRIIDWSVYCFRDIQLTKRIHDICTSLNDLSIEKQQIHESYSISDKTEIVDAFQEMSFKHNKSNFNAINSFETPVKKIPIKKSTVAQQKAPCRKKMSKKQLFSTLNSCKMEIVFKE